MAEVRISGRVRTGGSLLVRYSGPGEPLRGFLVVGTGGLEFAVEINAEQADRLSRNAAAMAESLRTEAERYRGTLGKA